MNLLKAPEMFQPAGLDSGFSRHTPGKFRSMAVVLDIWANPIKQPRYSKVKAA
jgi:hypothetical protein